MRTGSAAGQLLAVPETVSGDESFDAIYHAYQSFVYRTCLSVLDDPHEAHDATQETFIRAYRQRRSLPEKPGPWLRVVARNHCLDIRRSRARAEQTAAVLRVVAAPAEDPASRTIDRAVLHEVMEGLRPRERKVLWLSAVEDRPLSSLADSLGLSYTGTAQLLHRARRRARQLIGEATAVLLPLLPERLRSRSASAWLQASQAGARLPELATAAAVAAVLVSGPWLANREAPVLPPAGSAAATSEPAAAAVPPGAAPAAAPSPGVSDLAPAREAAGGGPSGWSLSGQAPAGLAPDLGLAGVPVLTAVAPISLSLPGLITVSATSPLGAEVAFSVSAAGGSGRLEISCSKPSPSVFPIGTTTVGCGARDAAGQSSTGSFQVNVVGAPALSLQVPASLSVNSPTGQSVSVNFSATAQGGYGQPQVTCSPASGSAFPVGPTTVACTARDGSGEGTSASFSVTVVSAPGQITAVIAEIQGWNLNPLVSTSLTSKLDLARTSLIAGSTGLGCTQLNAFTTEVNAQAGSGLTAAQAARLRSEAATVRATAGCG